ncbi:hypothetical protein [Bacillus sp. HSf4]|uniref:hypothetical protein n=1 Tax=Bacillus sp. HSf4 TaxID=3035514 RepID=UPI00240913D2|nr:hypothetical protein [Bacillus sp. HSf4]WFA05707.1 hypothetical protein P3X63_02320 [Bacillus sp. HSf4]
MSISGLIHDSIPKNSFFDEQSYKFEKDKKHLSHLYLMAELTGIPDIHQHAKAIDGNQLAVGNDSFFMITKLPETIWSKLPIPSHEILQANHQQKELLSKALHHLSKQHPSAYELIKEFVRSIVWVTIQRDFIEKDTQITSASFPIMPLCIFISDKAAFHIPPNSLCTKNSYRFLAENLYHEAVHQVINMNLLLSDIFNESYDSATSAKIEIPWRHTQSIRNQYWELDRVFHAAIVYSKMMEFRLSELKDGSLYPEERKIFEEAAASGIRSAQHLSQALLNHKNSFTSDGVRLIEELANFIHDTAKALETHSV